MTDTTTLKAHRLVVAVRESAALHRTSWEAMVPDTHIVDAAWEPAEEAAYAGMANAKAELRRHICEAYGLTARELAALALP